MPTPSPVPAMGNQPIITVFKGARVTHVSSEKQLQLIVAGFLKDVQIGFLPNTLQLQNRNRLSPATVSRVPSTQQLRIIVNFITKEVTNKCVQPGDKMFHSSF